MLNMLWDAMSKLIARELGNVSICVCRTCIQSKPAYHLFAMRKIIHHIEKKRGIYITVVQLCVDVVLSYIKPASFILSYDLRDT